MKSRFAVCVLALLVLSLPPLLADLVNTHVKEAALDSTLRMLAKAGRVNVVIPAELNGLVVKDLRVSDAPIETAFEAVLRPFGYRAVLRDNVYMVEPDPAGAKGLVDIGVRQIRLQTVDLERLVAEQPPPQRQFRLPGGVSVVIGHLFQQCAIQLLAKNAASVLNETHGTALPDLPMRVRVSQGQGPQIGTVVGPATAVMTTMTREGGKTGLLVRFEVPLFNFGAHKEGKFELALPEVVLASGEEVWVTGWQGLVSLMQPEAGTDVALVIQPTMLPPEK